MRIRRFAIYMAILAAAALSGCGEDEARTAPVSRAEDGEYLKTLDAQRDERKVIMKRVDEARRALESAKVDGASADEVAALERKLEAALEEFKANREKSQAIVAERINREIKEKKDFKKGNK